MMDQTFLLFAVIVVVVVGVIAFFTGRRGSGAGSEKIDQMMLAQAELSGRMQSSVSSLNERLESLTGRIGDGLAEQTEKTGEKLEDLQKRLAVIDTAQKNITDLSQHVVGLQDILSNKQARGAFGEIQLESLVKDFLPISSFEFQAQMSNGSRVDCIIKLPSPPGIIPIDSKFPLEAYRAIQNASGDAEKQTANRDFARDVGIHIKSIAEKYIIANETDWAIMFLPSEAIFAELNSNFANIIEDAHRRRVGIVSPTTLMALVNTISAVLKDGQMKEQAGLIQQQVELMLNDVRLLDDRVGKLKTHFRQANEDIDGIVTSSGKISNRGQKIQDVQLDDDEKIESPETPRPHLKEV
ncbi:MAG: DNA recombination protein RmuC [Proteobacteria bacterium]|nr:DNA recombination protein RmuC [Pseudomonadota bacterium]